MKFLLMFAAISAALSVLLGAFGAHALKTHIGDNALGYFQTAVHYQMTHSLAMLGFLVFYHSRKNEWLVWGARSFAFGIIFFSGSLYILALTNLKWVGPITPLGGLCFVAGWVCLLVTAYEYEN